VRKAPAYTTLRFILRGLDGAQLERVFRQHAAGLPTPAAEEGASPICVAIDGKTLRGSFDAFNDRKAAHVLSAFASDDQIILGHMAIAEKSNEIPAAQDMIATLGLSGRLFTLDAMHAQKNIRSRPGHGKPSAERWPGSSTQRFGFDKWSVCRSVSLCAIAGASRREGVARPE
jgi:hypothetical protein